ncbi:MULTISPECIES: amino acid ABC transporter permease [Pseudomonas]|uniref:amino acid ABC transporter permease n=1 Tax=Pseudomonas TaxID=286 RepID=UPI000D1FE7DC|nr:MULTISPECIES: amino acid ABC transporter permease [Pseudomonas]AVZ17468.1 amino acid ABC transporter permease [Pseudomonas aeruginosa]MCM8589377.1 amino acid ABC transporter permease [Pseudomonas aeruginosa]MCM8673288.1 amino acid ABC transporter permease [Pseudomonas aeruginosa]MCP2653235.1 amino acid ABC transporter permease [Pseudomonas aeruginosa]MCT5442766.1 amino acid ABC transporter permease [Pseudomonas aeruginosa]
MDSLALVVNTLPIMLNGALITLEFAVASMVLGLIVGLVVAIMRISDNLFLSGIARVYVSLMRGTPLLVQIFVVYYGLPSIGISLEPVAAGIFTLTLNTGAYLSESMRGAILGISRGQWAASNSLGFTHVQTLRYVVCPQALRLAVPSLGNTLIGLIKDTSLVSVITVTELLRTTQEAIASSFQPLPLYVAAAAIYWILSTALSWLQERVEKRCALVANH